MHLPRYSKYILIVAVVVGLLVWLYNAYRLGKFRKPDDDTPPKAVNLKREKLLLSAGIVGLVLLAAILAFVL